MTTRPRRATAPARLGTNGNFRLLWFGEAISVLGSMTTTVILPLLAVLAFDASAQWMGLLTACAWLPWLLLGLPAGAWIDRGDNRRIMIIADLLGGAVLVSVPVAWALGLLTLPHLLLATLGGGVKDVFFRTAYPGLLTRLVRTEDLERANGRIYGTESAMQVAGPGLGGLLVSIVGAAFGLLAGVVGFLISAVCLWRIQPPPPSPHAQPDETRESLLQMVASGLRVTFGDAYLRWFAVQGGLTNVALTGYQTLLVLWMVRELGVTPNGVGLLMAAGSVGGLLGAAVAGRLSRRFGSARAMVALQLVGGPTALLIGAAQPGPLVSLIPLGAALVGLGVVGANVVRGAFRQRWTPPELLGRTMGAISVLNMGLMPLAGLAGGWLGSAWGLRPTILGMAGLLAVVSLSTLWSPWSRLRDLPTGQLDPTARAPGEAPDTG